MTADPTQPTAHAARAGLIHLRANLVRLADEAEGIANHMTGKGAPRARSEVANLARKMRDLAMAKEMVEASGNAAWDRPV